MQPFFKVSGNFVPNFTKFETKDNTENVQARRRNRSTSLEPLLKLAKASQNDNTQKTSEIRKNSSPVKLESLKQITAKKSGVNSSMNESMDTSIIVHRNSVILDRESITARPDYGGEPDAISARLVVPEISYRKLSDGGENGQNNITRSKTSIRSSSVSKSIILMRSETKVIEEKPTNFQQDANRSMLKFYRQEMDNSPSRILDGKSQQIVRKADSLERLQKVPSIVRGTQRRTTLVNIGNLPTETNFDAKPQIRRKIKVHKYSMLSFVKQDPQEPLNITKKSPEEESPERNQDFSSLAQKHTESMKSIPQPVSVILQSSGTEKKANLIFKSARNEDTVLKSRPYIEEDRGPNDTATYQFLKVSPTDKKTSTERDLSKEGTRESSLEKKAKSPQSIAQSIELSPIKVKAPRKGSANPLFDDEGIWEFTDGKEEPKPQPQESPENRKAKRKPFMTKLLRCLKKMKKLKLSPKEVYENQKIFSDIPFERAESEEFIKAAKTGNVFEIKQLLKLNSKYLVYDFDHLYQTALHWAVKKDYEEITRILIENGADVDATDIAGRTPLYFAIQNNSISTLKLLLINHAEPWGCEDCLYKTLCKSDVALYYLTRAQQMTILYKMISRNGRREFWETEVTKVLLGSKFAFNEDLVRSLFNKYILEEFDSYIKVR